MVGGALVRRLQSEDAEILTAPRSELDLRDQSAVFSWVHNHRPDAVILAAAKVGGIHANATYPAQFLYDNLTLEANCIEAARRVGVEKLLFLGSSCIYPRLADQPMREDALLTGALEPTNEWYAIAKIAGIKLCDAYRREYGCDYISAMPTNLYGPGDNFHPENSHVLPALMRRFDEAKTQAHGSVSIWGTGAPLREFMHVDDCADALVFLMKHYAQDGHVNVGSGEEISIADLAKLIADAVGYSGDVIFDPSKPDGTPRKLMDTAKLNALGWTAQIPLRQGVADTYRWYQAHRDRLRRA